MRVRDSAEGNPPRRLRPGPLSAAVGLASISVFPAFLVGAVGVQMRADLQLGQAQLGSAVASYFAVSMVLVALLGRAVDQIGVRRGYILGAGLAVASLVGIGALASGWLMLVVCLAVGGVGNAIVGPTSSRLLAHSVPPARRGTAFGVKQSSIMGATLLGGVGVPTVALTVGWRWVFLGGAVLALCLYLMTPRDGPTAPLDHVTGELSRHGRSTLLLLALAFGLGTSTSVTLTTFLVDYLVVRGVVEGMAGVLLAAGGVGAIAVRILFGWWTDRGLARLDATMAAMFVVAAVALVVITIVEGVALGVVAVVAFAAAWGWTGILVYTVAVGNLAAPGSAAGVVQTGAAAGGMLGPTVLGFIAEHASYDLMWVVGAACSLAAAGCVVTALRMHGSRVPGSSA
jgi:predicted MFS family arabinose efflux permease